MAYHGTKSTNALSKAEIQPGDPLYNESVALVGLAGPIGLNNFSKVLNKALAQNLVERSYVGTLLLDSPGKALAEYWGISQARLLAQTGFSNAVNTGKRAAQEGWKQLKAAWND